ncbi:MAG: hypothetical protein MZU97_17290 [Bacillus subtilis]|nr:hypothetical protein [Bacillus subtilis]
MKTEEMLMLELHLSEKSLDEAVGQIIDEAMNLGFINVQEEQTEIQVDAVGNTDAISEQVRQTVQDKLQTKMSDRALNANVQAKNYDAEFAAQASEQWRQSCEIPVDDANDECWMPSYPTMKSPNSTRKE